MKPDEIKLTVMDDGSVKIETGKISSPIHMRAERALLEIKRLLGGSTTKQSHGVQGQVIKTDQEVKQ